MKKKLLIILATVFLLQAMIPVAFADSKNDDYLQGTLYRTANAAQGVDYNSSLPPEVQMQLWIGTGTTTNALSKDAVMDKFTKSIQDGTKANEGLKAAASVNSNGLPLNSMISGWTKHGTEQALGRDGGIGVSNNAILDAVNNPINITYNKTKGTTKFDGKNASVVLNDNSEVVTTIPKNSSGTRGGTK